MLVLGRSLDDVVIITNPDGTKIKITVVDLRRGHVRLGFDAPPEIKINRADRKNQEDSNASK